MKLTQLTSSKEIHALYSPDKRTQSMDYNKEKGLYEKFACTTLLLIERDGKLISTSEWFITDTNNELIYDIADNNWVNLDLFDAGDSYCKGLYTLDLANVTDRITVIPQTTLTIPPFVAEWYNKEDEDRSDDDLFDDILSLNWYGESPEDYVTDDLPLEIIEYANNRTNRLLLLRILNGERFTIAE